MQPSYSRHLPTPLAGAVVYCRFRSGYSGGGRAGISPASLTYQQTFQTLTEGKFDVKQTFRSSAFRSAGQASSLDSIGSFVYVPSHSVKGKPVKIRRCPATVKGDDDPTSHCESGKADPRMNPKPGNLPSVSKQFAFRGEGGSAFCARSRFEFRDSISQ
jgi:hypothetical protein